MDEQINTAAERAEAAALPRRYEAHTCDDRPAGDQPVPPGVAAHAATKSPAQWAYERIVLYLQEFEKQLDREQEVAIAFAGSDGGVLRIEGMGYFDPDIVTFYGQDAGGGRSQMIQHVTQLNVMLRALPRIPDTTEPVRVGFELARRMADT